MCGVGDVMVETPVPGEMEERSMDKAGDVGVDEAEG